MSAERPKNEEANKFFLSVNQIPNAQGSSFVELLNGTKLFCAVYGPRQLLQNDCNEGDRSKLKGSISIDVKVTKQARTSRKKREQSEQDFELDLRNKLLSSVEPAILFELIPKSCVDVRCLIVDSKGEELRALVIACSAALIEAKVCVRDVVSACTVCVSHRGECAMDDDLVWDSSSGKNSRRARVAKVTVCALPKLGKVTQILSQGRFESSSSLKKCERMALEGCADVSNAIKNSLF